MEEVGFEPPDLLQSTVFKTVAIDHSATLPPSQVNGVGLEPTSPGSGPDVLPLDEPSVNAKEALYWGNIISHS